MSIPDQAAVQAILQRIHDVLHGTVLNAWQDWFTNPEAHQYRYPRTRACIVWERMVRCAEEAFAADTGIRFIRKPQTVWFLVDDQVLLRFKKGDEKGLSSNIPTQLALAFHDHQLPLPDVPKVARVEIVYVLNPLETAIASIQVVARDGVRIAWTYEIAAKTTTTVAELPIAPSRATPTKQLVKLRQSDESQDDETESHSE